MTNTRSFELIERISAAQRELVGIQRSCAHETWQFAREVHIESEMAHAVVKCTKCQKEETRDFFHSCPVCTSALEIAGVPDGRMHVIYSFSCPSCNFSSTQRVVDY